MKLQSQEQSITIKNSERLDYIDVVKGLSIISIVLLHFENGLIPGCVNAYIGGYMISAFYVAVGWIGATKNKEISTRDLVRKRWIQIGKPYLYWSLIILLFELLLWAFGHYDLYVVERDLYKTATLRGIGTLWFLPALFGGEVLWNWTKTKNNKLLYLFLFIAIIVYHNVFWYYFSGKDDSMSRIISAPFQSLYSMGDAWIGIAFGYFTYTFFSGSLKRQSSVVTLCEGLILSVIAFLSANYIPIVNLERLACPLLGPLGLFLIFKVVKIPILTQYFNYWGVNSLGLMVVHFSILLEICTIVQNKLDGTTGQTLFGWTSVLHFVICLIVSYFLVEAVKKYCPQLLGKNKTVLK